MTNETNQRKRNKAMRLGNGPVGPVQETKSKGHLLFSCPRVHAGHTAMERTRSLFFCIAESAVENVSETEEVALPLFQV